MHTTTLPILRTAVIDMIHSHPSKQLYETVWARRRQHPEPIQCSQTPLESPAGATRAAVHTA